MTTTSLMGDAYDKLCKMLDAAPNFSYRNYSVPKDNPVHNASNEQELHSAIKDRMQWAEVVVIMAGKYASYSKWIRREIQIAKQEFGKQVLAVRPWANLQASSVVQQNADKIVRWNTNSIVSGIRELAP